MNKMILLFIGIVLLTSASLAQNYQLVWSDEFTDTALNDFIWKYNLTNNNGWGNNELEYYTNNSTNISLSNGNLLITARKENYQGFQYTSARIETRIAWTYGKIEARIKLPYGQGIWPAFWMLGNNINSVGWPKCGEIDIMEMIGGQNRENTIYGTAHWYSNGHAQYGLSYKLPTGNFSDGFHIFDITWDSQKIIWHVDGIQYCRIDLNSSLSAFQAPFFILLNLAVGGNWPGNPNNTTIFPQTMTVDYVRVYQIAPTDVETTSSIVNNFSLEQNYPNPFNPSTVIKYSIAVAGNVTLKIFDLLGREVAQLVNKYHEIGNFSVNFDASKLSAGVYIYTLSFGRFSQSKKLMVIK